MGLSFNRRFRTLKPFKSSPDNDDVDFLRWNKKHRGHFLTHLCCIKFKTSQFLSYVYGSISNLCLKESK